MDAKGPLGSNLASRMAEIDVIVEEKAAIVTSCDSQFAEVGSSDNSKV